MVRKLFRGVLIGGVLASVGLVFVGDVQPFCGLCKRPQATVAMAPVCNPCAPPMTASYVPQTSYRVSYAAVPVTTYQPVVSTNPCTGCQTTCMRPATCYQQQARYTPYTTYRIVYTPTQPACAPATTAYYAAPATAVSVAAPVAASGCSSCGTAGAAQTTFYAPNAAAVPGAAVLGTVVPSAAVAVPRPAYAYTYPSTVNYGATMSAATVAPGYAPAPAMQTVVAPQDPATMQMRTFVGPTVPSSAAPIYSGPTYMTPGAGATLSSPMIQPSPAIQSSPTIISSPTVNGDATVQPSLPANTSLSPIITTTTLSPTITTTTAVGPTFAPPQTPAPVETKIETQVEKSSTDVLTPIPDPLSRPESGPILNKTSSPRLFDPQDKTAVITPVEQPWSYAAVNPIVADKPVILTSAEVPGVIAGSSRVIGGSNLVERKRETATPAVVHQPTIDADGWRAASR